MIYSKDCGAAIVIFIRICEERQTANLIILVPLTENSLTIQFDVDSQKWSSVTHIPWILIKILSL